MKDRLLTNPRGAFVTTTTFVQFKDANGFLHEYDQSYIEVESNAAVPYGAPVIFTVPTTTAPMRVTPAGAAPVGALVRGIALNKASGAGEIVRVCVHGFCEVIVNETPTAAAAFGTFGTVTASEAGRVNSTAAAIDATTVVGTLLGMFLAAQHDETADLAPFWFEHF